MPEESLLYLPTLKEFLSFELNDLQNATDEEFQAMLDLNQSGADWANQKINAAEYTDILDWHDIDAEEHLKDLEWYLAQI